MLSQFDAHCSHDSALPSSPPGELAGGLRKENVLRDAANVLLQRIGALAHTVREEYNFCNGEDLDVCSECCEIGGHCLGSNHELPQRTDD